VTAAVARSNEPLETRRLDVSLNFLILPFHPVHIRAKVKGKKGLEIIRGSPESEGLAKAIFSLLDYLRSSILLLVLCFREKQRGQKPN
jgi:hypothetical protein